MGETEEAQKKIQELVKANPKLQSAAAEKLNAVLESLKDEEAEDPAASDIDKLYSGFKKFKKNVYEKNPELTHSLKTGQWPKFMVIACADSRVDPSTLLGFQPGDAFIIRNVANMVPPYESEGYPSIGSSVEYAVLHLKVKKILVIGHRACGGVNALIRMTPDDGKYSTDFIERWVAIGKPAREAVKPKPDQLDAAVKAAEKESVKNSLNNLVSYPFVKKALADKVLELHGGYYDHIEGSFSTWDFATKTPRKSV